MPRKECCYTRRTLGTNPCTSKRQQTNRQESIMDPKEACKKNCDEMASQFPQHLSSECIEQCPRCDILTLPTGSESIKDELGVETMCEDLCRLSADPVNELNCQRSCPSNWCQVYTNAYQEDPTSISPELIIAITVFLVVLLVISIILGVKYYRRSRWVKETRGPLAQPSDAS